MSVRVLIPGPLRRLAGDVAEIRLEGETVLDVVRNLEANAPGLRKKLTTDNGEIRRFIKLFLNEEDIDSLEGPDTPVRDGDELAIVPAAAGG